LRKDEPVAQERAFGERTRQNAKATGCFGNDRGPDAFALEDLSSPFDVDARGNPQMDWRCLVLRLAPRLRALEAEPMEITLREPARVG
jgi:hypothetical protein